MRLPLLLLLSVFVQNCGQGSGSEAKNNRSNVKKLGQKIDASELGSNDRLAAFKAGDGKKIRLPLRVLSQGGPVHRTLTLKLDDSIHSNAKTLYVQMHRPAYRFRSAAILGSRHADKVTPIPKAWVQVNDGEIIDLIEGESTGRLTVGSATEKYGGLGGGYHTNKLYIDLESDLLSGENKIKFGFYGHKKETIGYRVVDLDLLNEGGKQLLPRSEFFKIEDPNISGAFSATIGDAARGQKLWQGLKEVDGKWTREPLNFFPGSKAKMKAACADCHARDGGDLQYFGYSNESIWKRSVFHGLSRAEGEDIAAYIRSNPSTILGRPWNPPYQPSKNLDQKEEEWHAGGGLGSILEQDTDMHQQLFGSSPNPDYKTVQSVFDIEKTLNMRNLQLAVQLPDWNAWLPEVHPADHFDQDGFDWFESAAPQKHFDDLTNPSRTSLFIGTPAAAAEKANEYESGVNRLRFLMSRLHTLSRNFLGKTCGGASNPKCKVRSTGNSGSSWRIVESPIIDDLFDISTKYPNGQPMTIYDAKRDMARWQAVKQWELVQGSQMARFADPGYSGHTGSKKIYPRGERLAWIGDGQGPWPIAPHITGEERLAFPYQNIRVARYDSSVWYQLQVILNPGLREPTDILPTDWPYQINHIVHLFNDNEKKGIQPKPEFRYFNTELADRYDYGEPYRYYTTLLKLLQSRNLPTNNSESLGRMGWSMRLVSPWRIFSHWNGNTEIFAAMDEKAGGKGLRSKIVRALLDDWLVKGNRYSKSDGEGWDSIRCANATHGPNPSFWGCIQPSSYVPRDTSNANRRLFEVSSSAMHDNPKVADVLYRLIPALRTEFGWGKDHGIVKRIRNFGKDLWSTPTAVTKWDAMVSCTYNSSGKLSCD